MNLSENSSGAALPGGSARVSAWGRRLPGLLLLLFLAAALLADLWPARNVYFLVFHKVDGLLTMEFPLTPAMRYASSHSENSADALPYAALVNLFHLILPGRLLCLRAVSIASTLAALYLFYRMSLLLFSRPVGLLFLFLLVTSPAYLESMRSIGFIPPTNALVAAGCYLLALLLKEKRCRPGVVCLLAFCCFLTFSLYALGRLLVILTLAILLFYGKSHWRKLLLLLICLVVLIYGSDLVFGDLRFDFNDWYQVGGEWLMASDGTVPDMLKVLTADIRINSRNFFNALIQIRRTPFKEPTFEEDIGTSRLFNPAYSLFFFLGFFLCLKRRSRGEILLLAWFGLFFILPLFSSDFSARRTVFALNPIFLIIAVGIWEGYKYLRRRLRTPRARKLLGRTGMGLLLAVGVFELYQFFFLVAAPVCGYSRSQLRETARFINERGREVSSICLRTVPSDQALIWGNPWIDPRFIDKDILHKIVYDFMEEPDIRKHIELARSEGIGVLFLYPFPPDPEELTPDQVELRSALRELGQAPPPGLEITVVPGTEIYALLVEDDGFSIPPLANRSYRYFQDPAARSVFISSEYSYDQCNIHIVDGLHPNPDRFWRISHARLGEPAWVIVDFGKGVKKQVKTVSARPRRDRPEEFFRRAELLGSDDGINWEPVAPVIQEEVPSDGEWRKWSFPNDRSYRSYKLLIYDGHAGRAGNFLSLAGLRLEEE